MVSLICAAATSTVTECPSSREFALRQKLALRSAHDSIMAAHTKLKQTRDAIHTNQKRLAVPFKWGDFVYLPITNMFFPKSKGLTRKPTYLVIPKVKGSQKTLGDFGITSIQLDSHSRLKSRRVCDIFHSSVLLIPATSDDILLSGHMETQLNGINDSDEAQKLMEHPISTRAEYELETVTVFEDKYRDFLGIHHIAQLSRSTGTSEDCSTHLTGATRHHPSPLFSFCLHTPFFTFISLLFLCPCQPSFINPTVDLERHSPPPTSPPCHLSATCPIRAHLSATTPYQISRMSFHHHISRLSNSSPSTVHEHSCTSTGLDSDHSNCSQQIHNITSTKLEHTVDGFIILHPTSFDQSSTTEAIEKRSDESC